MTAQTARTIITQHAADLPEELLQEVIDFIEFVRFKRFGEMPAAAVVAELQALRQREWTHLEEEFSDLDKHFPRQSS